MLDVNESRTPRIGDVYMASFDGVGSEQRGIRPALIFQNNVGNVHSPNVIVLPLTSKIKKIHQPTHVLIRSEGTGLKRDSMVLCENPMSISKSRLGEYITTLPDECIGRIAIAHILATASIAFVNPESLLPLMEMSRKLNMGPLHS